MTKVKVMIHCCCCNGRFYGFGDDETDAYELAYVEFFSHNKECNIDWPDGAVPAFVWSSEEGIHVQ